MSNKNRNSTWNKIKGEVEAFFRSTSNKIVFTADNSELDFYELGEDETPKVKDGETPGDKAKYDGKPAGESNNGEYVMASGETYKFNGEELIEITPKEEETTKDSNLKAENEALKEEVQNLKTTISNLNTKNSLFQNQLSTARNIIKKFENLESEIDDDPETQRNPKPNPAPKRNLFKNLNP